MALNLPILFIVFNRKNTAQKVFDVIKAQQPRYLYVAADGPRPNRPDDIEKCQTVRDIILQIDWDCEVKTLFQSKNLGCAKGPATAITWFFKHVEQGIILEDDCIPHPDFFHYCEYLLDYYKDNERIWMISGDNYMNVTKYGDGSYYYSAYPFTCGWATWRRVWQHFDLYLKGYSLHEFDEVSKRYSTCWNERMVNRDKFLIMKKRGMQAWDFQFMYSMWKYGGLGVIPNKNLILNIGVGEDSTHFVKQNSASSVLQLPTHAIGHIVHPSEIVQNIEADHYYYKNNLHKSMLRLLWRFVRRQFVKPQFSIDDLPT